MTDSSTCEIEQMPARHDLYVIRESKGKGRGLFATSRIPAGTLLERAPCIRIPKSQYESHLKYTELENYVFQLSGGDVFVALGNGSIFNHDKDPNVDYRLNDEENTVEYYAIRKNAEANEGYIESDQELCIYYGHRPEWDVYTQPENDSESELEESGVSEDS